MRRTAATAALVALLVGGCGDASTPDTTQDVGGSPSVPRQSTAGELGGRRSPTGGTVRLAPDGCWFLEDVDGQRRMLVWPPATEVGDDGASILLDDATVLVPGTVIEGSGTRLGVRALAADGFVAQIAGFCAPTGVDVAVLDAVLVVVAPTDVPPLSTAFPCGHGFQVASGDQRAALLLTPADGGPDPHGPVEVDLADGAWLAELRVGRELMSNWCDDVVEPGEPEPRTLARWPVVAGMLRFTAPGAGCRDAVTADVTGIVVRTGDADADVALPDMTIVNDAWGCFAG